MNLLQWIENAYNNGELFFYIIPVFLFIILFVVIFIPDAESVADKQKEKDPETDKKEVKPAKAETINLTKSDEKDLEERSVSMTIDLTRGIEEPEEKKEPAEKIEPEKKADFEEKIEIEEKAPEVKKATLKEGLEKTRGGFISKLKGIFGSKAIDDDVIEELEEILYTADIGVKTVAWLMEELQKNRSGLKEGEDIKNFLKEKIREVLLSVHKKMPEINEKPAVYLMVGVNGAGKTTTIGKLSSKFISEGKSCVLAAADTFRAAAVEQIKVWGERTGAIVISDKDGADPASVAHNAITSAVSKETDIVMIDTAGRLQNRINLMEELKKINRVVSNLREGAPHETILVIDANNGQNALSQAKQFNEAVNLSGIVVTKLDGTAKGGVLIGIAKELSIPVYMIGIGESLKDLRPFNPEEFVEALFL